MPVKDTIKKKRFVNSIFNHSPPNKGGKVLWGNNKFIALKIFMGTISSFLAFITTLSAIGLQSPHSSINSKQYDNYDYEFQSGATFDKTNGDEFEVLDSKEGGKSEISVKDVNGEVSVVKESKNSPAFNPDDRSAFSVNSYNDVREDNDSFQTASNAYDVGYYESGIYGMSSWLDATISQKTSGWWLWEKKYIDKDFYSFDSCVYGTITVTMTNVPSGYDYDLRAYKLEDGPNAKASTLNFDNYIAISNNVAGRDEKIVLAAEPGTYYFCVYSYQDKTFDNDNPYHIKFEQQVNDTTRDDVRYWISDGKVKGDLGAIWISDYKPLGYTPVTLSKSNAVVNVNNYNDYPYIRHLANKYTNGNYINYAVIYVWDLKTRACISAAAQKLVEIVESKTDWNDDQAKSVSIGMNTAGLVLTVAGIVIGTASMIVTGGMAAEALAATGILVNSAALPVSLSSFVMSFSSNAPYLATKKDLLAYLVSVQQTFSVGKGSNTDETKILRFRYRFDSKTHALNWSPFYSASDYNYYNNDYISFQIEHSGIDGTIRGFQTESAIRAYLGA